jgi:hypothetical protein
VSTYPLVRQMPPARSTSHRSHAAAPAPAPPEADAARNEECLEFVRFCYRRRPVSWPALYDEMCAVAAGGSFKGLSYADLAEHGISFCLSDLPAMAALAERVMNEEQRTHEPVRGERRPALGMQLAPTG